MHLFLILCDFINQDLFFFLNLGLYFLSENNPHHIIGKCHMVFCNQSQPTDTHSLIRKMDLAHIFEKTWEM